MQCCCGRSDCAYLENNNAALGGLERDLETAARLGQALLDRHEAYVKDSQAEQARLSSYVACLENEKSSLQDVNHRMVVENRELLQKLEGLNTTFGESGKRVQELEALLQDCEQEIRRLNGLTRRTQELELKMLDVEKECADITKQFEDGKLETRSTIARWKESERKVRELEQEVQKIEWSARVDREKHEEIVARMERDRALERELGLSEGRLKATAAVQNMQREGPQKQVVSNFVRDILQDNANLQAGIAELRELLQTSNDEVQGLREQIMLHQPVEDESTPMPTRQLSLHDELASSQSLPKKVQQEVHVHHHYHTKLGAKKEKLPIRKTPRATPRRKALMPSAFTSSPSTSGRSTPVMRPQRYVTSPAVPLSMPQAKDNRWSMQSVATNSTYLSSMASSPRSYFDRNSSIFDRVEREEESSRPTSPESFTIASPMPFKPRVRPDGRELSVFEEESSDEVDLEPMEPTISDDAPGLETTYAEPMFTDSQDDTLSHMVLTPKSSTNLHYPADQDLTPRASQPSIPEPPAPPDTSQNGNTLTDTSPSSVAAIKQESPPIMQDDQRSLEPEPPQQLTHPSSSHVPEIRPSIRRSNSHDSLLSISGMDIHLAQHPHSSSSALRLLGSASFSANKHHFAPKPTTLRQPLTSASQPLASVTQYTATSRPGLDNISASMQALSGIRKEAQQTQTQNSRGLIGSVGGWVTSKWGRAPTGMKSAADLRSVATVSTSSASTFSRPSLTTSHFATTPTLQVVKSSDASTLSAGTSSTVKSNDTAGKRSVSSNALSIPTPSSDETSSTDSMSGSLGAGTFFGRPPGINQLGPIPGFAAAVAAKRVPTTVTPTVDVGGLTESLAE
ncbi:hypothetical protein LTR70_003235 [Exophiala xenobiotica]|uniref:Uncharacterized protein n=1 Tax=Lithohypha guttulata TaxID=1690604 RepID=A0ABR0KHP8_9EURO|nr:hypothetical protein LTR24_002880 [Lithohypha guttulata]KAK5323747.1 hypothetical protein LTR70_003235 [Exophiala xenobiotica]